MFQIKHESFVTKTKNKKQFHVEFKLLQVDPYMSYFSTFICQKQRKNLLNQQIQGFINDMLMI